MQKPPKHKWKTIISSHPTRNAATLNYTSHPVQKKHMDLYPNTTMKIDTVEPSSAITKYHFQYQWPVRNYYFFTKEIPTFTFIFNCSMGMGNHTMILISHASEWLLCTFCPSHKKKRISSCREKWVEKGYLLHPFQKITRSLLRKHVPKNSSVEKSVPLSFWHHFYWNWPFFRTVFRA